MSRYQWPSEGKSKDRPFERLSYNALTDGFLSADALIAAHNLRQEMRPDVPASGPVPLDAPSGDVNLWVPIGPSTVLQGQAGSRPRVAGRVRDLFISPDGQRAYVATANGGVWYSGDAGTNWSPLGNWLPTPTEDPTDTDEPINLAIQALTCGCLLVIFGAAADGSGDVVYVGTGELVPRTQGTPPGKLGGVGVLHLDKPLPAALTDPFGAHWKREAENLMGYGIYRLARDPAPGANQLVAATSIGLFTRTGGFVENADWTRVSADPFNFGASDGKRTTDVIWVNTGPAASPAPRLVVALQDGASTAVYVSANGVAGPFQKVGLPGVQADTDRRHARLGLAAAPNDPKKVYVLGTGPRLWRIADATASPATATQVNDIPLKLFGDGNDQSDYDLAIAVHPDNADIVAFGGSTINADGQWSASLFKCTITGAEPNLSAGFLAANQDGAKHADDITYIGNGVHADVHQIRFLKAGAGVHMWVGCDGGVFRSRDAGNRHSFVPSNTGLAVLETGYLASHPENDAFVIAGAQDNGTLLRVGDTVWLYTDNHPEGGGDGGGLLFHPVQKQYFAAQSFSAIWHSNGALLRPIFRSGFPGTSSEQSESRYSSFYSNGDVHQVGVTGQVRLAIGTNRVWLADNWDPLAAATSWFTLPSRNDPRGAGGADEVTDTYGERTGRVIACRWVDANRLLALMQSWFKLDGKDSVVLLFTRKADGTWERKEISKHANKCSDYGNGDISQPTSDYLPPLGAWSDLAVHEPTRGTKGSGSFYVACTGHVAPNGTVSERMDTLWWYDGTSKWYPTGLRTANSPPGNVGTKAPAYAVVCDPGDPTVVYVGTGVGVWRGVVTFSGGNPSWVWNGLVNGLPIAAVQDLSLYRGPVKILRAAIQARGIWEVDLSAAPTPTRRTFLRVHANDARRQATTSLVNPMKMGPPTEWPWHASPDVRIRPAPLDAGEAIPRPPTTGLKKLPWKGTAPDSHLLWVFQTALHKIDPLCRANGEWTAQFRNRLEQLPHPEPPPASGNSINLDRWNHVVTRANVFTAPWDGAEPTEADLFELIVEYPPTIGAGPAQGPPEISEVERRKYKIDVLIHHRDLRPLAFGDIRVTLLRRPITEARAAWPAIAIGAQWKTRVEQLMSGSPPAGWSLPDNWAVADAASPTRQPTANVDARTPRAVTFDVGFSGAPLNRHFVLLAVVHSAPDPVSVASLAGDSLKDLILKCHHVAARVVKVRREIGKII